MDSILFFFDRINRIYRIFFSGFPEESLKTPIAFGENKTKIFSFFRKLRKICQNPVKSCKSCLINLYKIRIHSLLIETHGISRTFSRGEKK